MKNKNPDKKVTVDREKCIRCKRCADICWNGAMQMDSDGYPHMNVTDLTNEWKICWECQRCMAGCTTGALSIMGKDPNEMLPRKLLPTPQQIDALITNRRSCRKFKQENVDKDLIRHILKICGNSPTGSCNQLYEFTVIDDIHVMKEFTDILRDEMYEQAENGIYPPRFTKEDLQLFKEKYDAGEEFAFRGAPHLLAAHAPIGKGEWVFDTAIALAYAELAMTCNDLGFIYVSTPWAAIQVCPRARAFLQIPENHYISCLVGFGKPEYQFARGVQRSDALKINRITSETTKEQL